MTDERSNTMADGKDTTHEQRDQLYFLALVQNFQHLAWAGLGKVANPGQTEEKVDLEQAHWAIDMLAMIQRRTKGNLSSEEDRELAQVLHTLRMNYVDESEREKKRAAEAAETKSDEDKPAEEAPENEPVETSDDQPESTNE